MYYFKHLPIRSHAGLSEYLAALRQLEQGPKAGGTTRRGANIGATVTVPVEVAKYGGFARVLLPTGRAVEIKVPAGANDGAQFRLRGLGRPGANGGEAGDAVVSLEIERSGWATHGRDESK